MTKEKKMIETLSKNLIYYRTQNNLTQVELANKIDYSDKSISKWERMEGIPDLLVLFRLADLYGIEINDLISEKRKQITNKRRNKRFLISLISILLPWLIATSLFVLGKILIDDNSRLWVLFIYAIPLSAIVSIIFTKLWGTKIQTFISLSLLYWSIPVSLMFSFPNKNMYMFFYVAIPIQVVSILWFKLKKYIK